jgi:hypothetical protein
MWATFAPTETSTVTYGTTPDSLDYQATGTSMTYYAVCAVPRGVGRARERLNTRQ